VTDEWKQKISQVVWVSYASPSAVPDRGIQATPVAIRHDVAVLRSAGFTGLVTYGGSKSFVREAVASAESLGFEGLILGVWDPGSGEELDAVAAEADSPIVLGYCVGNEGYIRRYSRDVLLQAIDDLRSRTGKPVTTTEESDDYIDEDVHSIGDWVFPNTHAYFHGRSDPDRAVRWTVGAFKELRRLSGRFVWLKEVGLPTMGDSAKPLSEAAQERFYVMLAKTPVVFTHFEGYDQPWKRPGTVEPNWGIFRANRAPKELGQRLLARGALPRPQLAWRDVAPVDARPVAGGGGGRERSYVYEDSDSPRNHFSPTAYDGDCGDIRVDPAFEEDPYRGKSCIQVVYKTEGRAPNECAYAPPCKWASLSWRHPPHNKGKDKRFAAKGVNLSGYRRLVFWARAETNCRMQFFVGGVDERYGDSLAYPRNLLADLSETWQRFEIDLADADLRHIITGLGWVTNWDLNPAGVTFYLDEVYFE
jgi:exo-beta-1,3-glucanase (GH17 family)